MKITKELILNQFELSSTKFRNLLKDYCKNYKGYEFFKITNSFKICNKYNLIVQKYTLAERIKTKVDGYSQSLDDFLNIEENVNLLNSLNKDVKEIISSIRRGQFLQCKLASNFPTTIARDIYENFLENDKDNIVLDFCAGWGDRLLAAKTCSKIKRYIGIDVNNNLIKNLHALNSEVIIYLDDLEIKNCHVMLSNKKAEEALKLIDNNWIDLIFTSPPYFNREQYENGKNKNQSYLKYKTLDQWLEKFLKVCIFESYRILKNNRYFILNIKDLKNPTYKLVGKTIEFALEAGFNFIELLEIPIKTNGTEPLLVFKKESGNKNE